jgi:hypothetical protein
MLSRKDFADCIDNVLTPFDLFEKMKVIIDAAKDTGIILNYGKGHFLIGHKKYRDGLAVSTDGFGVWEITELKSYELTDRKFLTEQTQTVVRAVASLLNTWEETR